MPLPPSACQVCGSRPSASLSTCSRCRAVQYCSREHQKEHFKAHKAVCKSIQQNRQLMAEEAEKIRNWGDDDFAMPANAFETHAGHFWGLFDTRPYMRAKMGVLTELSTINSRLAIEAALAEAIDCHRLCRSDNMGVRDVTPTLMLLLGKLQEAYDFIKWYETSGNSSTYDWGNMELPYLDIHGADMTEELPRNDRRYGDVFNAGSLTYIKMVLLRDVQDAINAHVLADQLESLQEKLTRQMREAFSLTHALNKHFWGAMLNPAPVLRMPDPEYFSRGDVSQIKVWIQQNAMLWRDHREFIRSNRGE